MSFSVRDLQIGEMINVSAYWLGPEQKATFLSIAEVAPLAGRVEAAHGSLVAARDGAGADAVLRALMDLADFLDERHDHQSRALYHLLLAAQHHELGKEPPDDARADEIERALDALFPNQLQAVIASYQAEAGNAAQLERLAKETFSELLGAIHIEKDVSALDIAASLGDVGRRLGVAESKKAEAAAAAERKTIPAAEIRNRMRAWATLAETILGILDHSSAPEEAIDAIRGPLVAAAEKATARRRDRQAAKGRTTLTSDPGENPDG
jgi:hypothetical protein